MLVGHQVGDTSGRDFGSYLMTFLNFEMVEAKGVHFRCTN